jgi:hypothetical protein
MIDRAGHRQLLSPVFSWSPPPRSAGAPQGEMPEHPEPADTPAEAAAVDSEDDRQSIEPIWVPTS